MAKLNNNSNQLSNMITPALMALSSLLMPEAVEVASAQKGQNPPAQKKQDPGLRESQFVVKKMDPEVEKTLREELKIVLGHISPELKNKINITFQALVKYELMHQKEVLNLAQKPQDKKSITEKNKAYSMLLTLNKDWAQHQKDIEIECKKIDPSKQPDAKKLTDKVLNTFRDHIPNVNESRLPIVDYNNLIRRQFHEHILGSMSRGLTTAEPKKTPVEPEKKK